MPLDTPLPLPLEMHSTIPAYLHTTPDKQCILPYNPHPLTRPSSDKPHP